MVKHKFPPGHANPIDLEKFGPRFEIEVRAPIIRDSRTSLFGYPDPAPQNSSRMPALIDTGAGRTVLTPAAVERVGLPLVDYTMLSRAGGTDRVGAHVCSIHFPRHKLATIEIIQVVCCEIPGDLFQCLIGRDILARWLFTYNGRSGEWSIEEEDLAAWVEPPEGMLT